MRTAASASRPQYFFGILVLTLVGSYVNLPLVQFPESQVMSPQLVTVFGVPYVVPLVTDYPGTLLAINVGGGLIPILLSLYLIAKNRIYRQAAWGVLIVCDSLLRHGRAGAPASASRSRSSTRPSSPRSWRWCSPEHTPRRSPTSPEASER